MTLGYALAGAAVAALSAEIVLLAAVRRRGLREYFAREVTEFTLHIGIFSLLATLSCVLAPPEIYEAALKNIGEAEQLMLTLHRKLLQAAAGAAFLHLLLTLYLGYSGEIDIGSTLAQYAYELDGFLGPLSQLANTAGLLGRMLNHLATLLKLSELLRPIYDALLASILVPRLRRFTTPLVAFLFVLTVVAPYSLALLTPQLQPLPEVARVNTVGKVLVRVYDESQMPVIGALLIALKDDEERVYVARVRDPTELVLPEGNYTALWVAAYFTNFTVPGCCYSPAPYVSCSCPIWPARFSVKAGGATTLLVNLPVNFIYCDGGIGGIYVASRGDSPLRGAAGNCAALLALEPPGGYLIAARAGPYRLSVTNGTLIAVGETCWRVTLTRSATLPPGVVMDFGVLKRNREYYEWWWEKVSRALLDRVRELLAPAKVSAPEFLEYGLAISFTRDECTSEASREVRVVLEGRCCWNMTHAVPYNPFWEEHYNLAARLPALTSDVVRLGSITSNAALLLLAWGGGLLAALAVSTSVVPHVVRELSSHVFRYPADGSRLLHGARLFARTFLSSRSAVWMRQAFDLTPQAEIFARVVRGTAATLGRKPVPALLAAMMRARVPRGELSGTLGRRDVEGRRLLNALYSLSTYPSFGQQLKISSRVSRPLIESLLLLSQLAHEGYYKLRGYKVLLPYSLTAHEVVHYAMRNIAGYVEAVNQRYAREVEELGRKVAERLPEITRTKGWEIYQLCLRTASTPFSYYGALRVLLDAHPSARKVVAELTGIAPSPWMGLDLNLALHLKILKELAAEGVPWADQVAGLLFWSNYRFAETWSSRARPYMSRVRRGLRCRLEVLRHFYW